MQVIRETEPDIEDHAVDVAGLAVAVGDILGLDPDALERLDQAALFHDVGKIGIPDSILHKPGPLDPSEWEFVQRHTIIGERILAASPALRGAARIVRSSHERVDGTGYPDRLRAGEIPPEALIIAACNAFHAMTTDRPYRPRRSRAEALAELRSTPVPNSTRQRSQRSSACSRRAASPWISTCKMLNPRVGIQHRKDP